MTEPTPNSPLVSILMPAFNHDRFVENAVRSVWQQTYPNIELVVVDDGSTDNTLSVLKDMGASSPIKMLIETQRNQGICRTLNRCYDLSSGNWIALLASDDAYKPEFVERMLQEALRHPKDSTVLHCDAFTIDERGREGARISAIRKLPPFEGDVFDKVVFGGGYMVPSTLFISRALREKVGDFDNTYKIEDFDYRIRLAAEASFVYVDSPLFQTRKVKGSLGSKRQVWVQDLFKTLEKHRILIGPNYNILVSRKHAKFAEIFILQLDFKDAYAHYVRSLSSLQRLQRIDMTARIILGVLRSFPRQFALWSLPEWYISAIRRAKHRVQLWYRRRC